MHNDTDHRKSLWKLANTVEDDELTRHLKFRAVHGHDLQKPDLIYDTLQSDRHIRLLTLLSGAIEDQIQCELKQAQIESPDTVYTALSYTWGDPNNRLAIRCNDAIVLVTVNLYSALLRLRHSEINQVLWIDALCINQSLEPDALSERAQQVRLMGKIFSSAQNVIVDLGGAKAEMQELLDILPLNDRRSDASGSWAESIDFKLVESIASTMTRHHFELAANLARRPWFCRVWVIQEFVLAQYVEMKIGTFTVAAEVPIMIFNLLAQYMQSHIGFNKSLPADRVMANMGCWADCWDFLQFLFSTRKSIHDSSQPNTSAFLLDIVGSCESTHRQDRIYGILGLFEEEYSSRFSVNYFERDSRLESRFAEILIKKNSLLPCLARAKGFNGDCPSWTPSILSAQKYDLSFKSISMYYRHFDACGLFGAICASVRDSDRTLVTPALRIDTVKSVSLPNGYQTFKVDLVAVPGKRGPDIRTALRMAFYYRYVSAWANEHFLDQEADERRKAVWRTLQWDCSDKGIRYDQGSTPIDTEIEVMRNMDEIMDGVIARRSWETFSANHIWCSGRLLRSFGMRLCRTTAGHMAVIPEKAVHDSEIWIIMGVPVPVVLRRVDRGHHVVVGLCYVHDMMDGQALDLMSRKFETVYIR